MKKLLIISLVLVVCLTACGSSEVNVENENPVIDTIASEITKVITEEAKISASKFNMDLDNIPFEYDLITGYYLDETDYLELNVFLNKTFTEEEKIELHNSLVDYFKTVVSDGIVYDLYGDGEYDKADTRASGTWIRGNINEKEYKIYFGGHAPLSYDGVDYPERYRITITPNN